MAYKATGIPRCVFSLGLRLAAVRGTTVLSQTAGLHSTPLIANSPTTQAAGASGAISEAEFHKLSDQFIEEVLLERLEELGDQIEMDGFDVVYSSGVLTLKLGSHGTFVINKQPPNKQIWLSSPRSGPKRYDYDRATHKWIYHRDKHSLDEVLSQELSDMLKTKVVFHSV
eukprot:jgi/Hompol1/2460/HPOL_006006-RA